MLTETVLFFTPALFGWSVSPALGSTQVRVDSVASLVAAVRDQPENSEIRIAAGVYRLNAPLDLKTGVRLIGAGIGKTTITHAETWKAGTATLPDPETNHEKFDRSGYLIRCVNDAKDIAVTDLTLKGPALHGAIFGFGNEGLNFHRLRIENFMSSGIRTYAMRRVKISGCTFVDAGQRWDNGKLGLTGGLTGGGIFAIWMSDTEIWNNRFLFTKTAPNEHYYGIKGREARRCRIHHNTIETGFSIELPFEGDEDVEIDHNILRYAVSIPKYAGGPVPKSGRTFHIHHNYFTDGYSIEFVRNGVEIDHNLFDFSAELDGSNLISAFGDAAAPGPATFHNNLVSNPGRGVIWMNEPYGRLEVRNNHIVARTTKTPRTDGLFGFHTQSDFRTFSFRDNIIECRGLQRPLFRNDESGHSRIENNRLIGITDKNRYANPMTGKPIGLEQPLKFQCGVNSELTVDGWKVSPSLVKANGKK
ncbi:MAG: right-handed parallel beta-helix repeat-containing protein [Fimbriimonas sp.]